MAELSPMSVYGRTGKWRGRGAGVTCPPWDAAGGRGSAAGVGEAGDIQRRRGRRRGDVLNMGHPQQPEQLRGVERHLEQG